MARWKLNGKHYLNVPGAEWEYKEQDLQTQEEVRHRMAVPRWLDPDDPKTRRNAAGDVIVCYEGSKQAPTDYIFVGTCTPDMVPMDEEAEELSAIEAKRGQHPIETLAGNGSYQEDILNRFMDMLVAAQAKQATAPNTSLQGVSPEAFASLQADVQALIEQNAALQAQLLEKAEPSEARRR
jgi:hypothetical protein